jgi:hypothetical protein
MGSAFGSHYRASQLQRYVIAGWAVTPLQAGINGNAAKT